MKKEAVSGIMMTLLLTSMLTLALNVQSAKASGTIYIRADGSIDPPTANITSLDNITYTFTGNNCDEIVVERDGIVVDGAGYTVQGSGSGNGFYLNGRSNVTIKSVRVQEFYEGIYVEHSSHITLLNNTVSNSTESGTHIDHSSSHCNISGNIATYNNMDGIVLTWGSNNNTIVNNTAKFNVGGGITLWGSCFNNIVINNTVYYNNINGISCIFESFNNTISNNTVYSNNQSGIWIGPNLVFQDGKWVPTPNQDPTRNNTISDNNIFSNDEVGICLYQSSTNNISDNTLSSNDGPNVVIIENSSYNTISGNNMSSTVYISIYVENSSYNTVVSNTVANGEQGIGIDLDSNDNALINNTVTNTEWGIWTQDCSGNVLRNNTMTGNIYNFAVYSTRYLLSDYVQDIDTSNTVDGKPVYYWINQRDRRVPTDAGTVYAVNCVNITVENLNLTPNSQGVTFANTTDSIIKNVTALNSNVGVLLTWSSNNTISDNTISSGVGIWTTGIYWPAYGIFLEASSIDNTIYHNNLIDNEIQAYDENNAFNNWHHPDLLEGNYWDDYPGVDDGSGTGKHGIYGDGIGDTDIPWPEPNFDYYPLMSPYEYWSNPIQGDINKDMKVDHEDLSQLATHYGSTSEKTNWNPNSDIDNNGLVDIFDVSITSTHWGETW